jgi:transposase
MICSHKIGITTTQVRPHQQERKKNTRFRAPRWIVERTIHRHNLFRRSKTRYDVHPENYLAFIRFANAITYWSRAVAQQNRLQDALLLTLVGFQID